MTKKTIENAAILIVDDEVSLRKTFQIFLKREGYRSIKMAGSFDEAIKKVSDDIFDLIICDIVLESNSGIDLLKRFRQLGIVCPVIIITGYPHIETASEAVRLGAFDYLPKPVEKDILIKTVRLAIQQYRLQLEKKEAELAKESYRSFLETIFRSVSDTIMSVDRDLNILNMNTAAKEFFARMNPAWQEGDTLEQMTTGNDLYQLPDKVKKVFRSGKEIADLRLEYCFSDLGCRLLSICISPLDNGRGGSDGCVLVFRDMSQKQLSNKQQRGHFHRLIGASASMQKIYMMIENIGKVDTSVLITGPSGTGKELVAEALHRESSRRGHPLIKVNCTAIPDNLMESELFGHKKGAFTGAEENRSGRILQADKGTLFLDEIGDISINMQLSLLRFLQEKTFYPVGRDKEVHVDVRVIAATNADLRQKVIDGSFREDLYYRLLIIDIHLPPLVERDGDISLLANYFLNRFAEKHEKTITGISEQAMRLLNQYLWPGNVRQLEHTIERACVLCQGTTISLDDLPDEILSFTSADDGEWEQETKPDYPHVNRVINHTLTEKERQDTDAIIAALIKTGGNKAKAARRLRIDRSTLYRKIKELHIDVDMFAT